MTTATEHIWSISYGGDEPMSHPFYRKILDSTMKQCMEHELEVEVTTYSGIDGMRCRIQYYQSHSDHFVVRETEEASWRGGRVHAIMIQDLINIHIC